MNIYKFNKIILAAAFVALSPCSYAVSYTQTIDGVVWTYEIADGEATIYQASFETKDTSGERRILRFPEKVDNDIPVTAVDGKYGYSRFPYDCDFVLSKNIKKIGESAFKGLNLREITLSENLEEIGERAFSSCSSLATITIPKKVKFIGKYAFSSCENLTNIVFAKDSELEAISGGMFDECSKLTHFIIPSKVKEIGKYAFYNVPLDSLEIPSSVKIIGDHAFACGSSGSVRHSITELKLNEGLEEIGEEAFLNCLFTSVKLPSSLKTLGPSCFHSCGNLSQVILPKGLTAIPHHAFMMTKINSISIPSSVKSIDSYAFAYAPLTELKIPEGVEEIHENAFWRCGALKKVTIPKSVTYIGNGSFYECGGLGTGLKVIDGWLVGLSDVATTKYTIDKNVKNIEAGILDYNSKNCVFTIVENHPTIVKEGMAFIYKPTKRLLQSRIDEYGLLYVPNGVEELQVHAFAQAGRVKPVYPKYFYLPSSVKRIICPAQQVGHHIFSRVLDSSTCFSDRKADEKLSELCATEGQKLVIYNYGCDILIYSQETGQLCGTYSVEGFLNKNLKLSSGYNYVIDGKLRLMGGAKVWIAPGANVTFTTDLSAKEDSVLFLGMGKCYASGVNFKHKNPELTSLSDFIFTTENLITEYVDPATLDVKWTDPLKGDEKPSTPPGPPALCVISADPKFGTVTGSGIFAAAKKVTIKATAAKGYVFAGWYEDEEFLKPLSIEGVDYRTASLALVMPDNDKSVYARFVAKEEDAASLLSDSLLVDELLPEAFEGELDPQEEANIRLTIKSLSLPKVVVTGLPTGLKFDAKTYIISGLTTAPGIYDVVCSVSNLSSGATPYKYTFRVKVKNFVDSLIPIPESFGPYIPGVTQSFVLEEAEGCSVTGLPAGLKWNVKTSTISGTPTKPGLYTVKFTKTVDNVKHTASASFEVLPLRVLHCENVKGAGSFAANAKVTLKATPKTGMVFAGWYEDAAFTTPVSIPGFDYRNPTLSLKMPESDMTLHARYITPKEDSLDMQLWDGMIGYVYLNKDDDGFDPIEKFKIKSVSFPTIKLSGLPAGLKYDAKTGLVTGKVTEKNKKWGYITVNVKNASGYTATAVYPLSVNGADDPVLSYPNEVGSVSLPLNISITTTTKFDNELVGSDYSSSETESDYGWSCSSSESSNTAISGLPSGLKIVTKSETQKEKYEGGSYTSTEKEYFLTGTPNKPGKYTVKISNKYTSRYTETGEDSFTDSDTVTSITKMDVYVQQPPSKYVEAVVVADCGYGTVVGSGVYATGSTVKLKATAKKGYVFVGWYSNEDTNEYFSLDPNASFVLDDYAPDTLFARFMPAFDDKVIEIELLPDKGMFFVDEDTLAIEFGGVGLLNFNIRNRPEDGFGSAASITSVKGLPSGITAVKTGSAITALTYKENASIKPGKYSVTITAKNLSGYTLNKTITLVVPHKPDEFFGVDQSEDGYTVIVGEKITDECESDIVSLGDILENIYYGYEGKLTASISGLPAGLSIKTSKKKDEYGDVEYTAKVVGAAQKVGTYIATIKVSGSYEGEKFNEKATFTVTVLPKSDY